MGEGIRGRRKARGMTLSELGEQVGVTASHISQIERGLIEPSLGLLRRIAQVLAVSVQQLFDSPPEQRVVLLPVARAPVITFPGFNGTYRFLSADSKDDLVFSRPIKVFEIELEAGMWLSDTPLQSVTDECCYVIDGALDFHIGAEPLHLDSGDSLFLPLHTEYHVFNAGPGTARILWANATTGMAL